MFNSQQLCLMLTYVRYNDSSSSLRRSLQNPRTALDTSAHLDSSPVLPHLPDDVNHVGALETSTDDSDNHEDGEVKRHSTLKVFKVTDTL